MYFWYFIVAIASLLENFSGVPFTRQWTLRISRAPAGLELAPDLPRVFPDQAENLLGADAAAMKTLKRGLNVHSNVVLPRTSSQNRNAFYVVISERGVRSWHAALRVLSKAVSVGVFAVGTATFASAQFISITIALMTLCLVLGVAVLGRVVALWMAKSLMEHEPIIHKIVGSDDEVGRYIKMITSIEGLLIEIKGHVIVNGVCVARRHEWLTLAKWIGVCAAPFDLRSLDVTHKRQRRCT